MWSTDWDKKAQDKGRKESVPPGHPDRAEVTRLMNINHIHSQPCEWKAGYIHLSLWRDNHVYLIFLVSPSACLWAWGSTDARDQTQISMHAPQVPYQLSQIWCLKQTCSVSVLGGCGLPHSYCAVHLYRIHASEVGEGPRCRSSVTLNEIAKSWM